jgi:hypothetical protein
MLRATNTFVFMLSGAKMLPGNAPRACASLVGNDDASGVFSEAFDGHS